MKFKLYVLFPIALICFVGCGKKQAELPPSLNAVSIEINIIDHREETAEDLSRVLTYLGEKGHKDILINGTYIYLPWTVPPVWVLQHTTILSMDFPLDYDLPDIDSNTKTLSKWVEKEGVRGVSISFRKDLPLRTALLILDYFNENDIYYEISSLINEKETTFTRLEQLY